MAKPKQTQARRQTYTLSVSEVQRWQYDQIERATRDISAMVCSQIERITEFLKRARDDDENAGDGCAKRPKWCKRITAEEICKMQQELIRFSMLAKMS